MWVTTRRRILLAPSSFTAAKMASTDSSEFIPQSSRSTSSPSANRKTLTRPSSNGMGKRSSNTPSATSLSASSTTFPAFSLSPGFRHSGKDGRIRLCRSSRLGLVTVAELRDHVANHPGAAGIARLRRVADLSEPKAESAMETRLRLLLVIAGLPRPEAQVSIRDDQGRFLGRPDLLYRIERLAIEYDGGNHRHRLADDNRRQNGLIGAGVRVLRFTAADVYGAPDAVVNQVRHGLVAARFV